MPLIYDIQPNMTDAQTASPRAVMAIFPFQYTEVLTAQAITQGQANDLLNAYSSDVTTKLRTDEPVIVTSDILSLSMTQNKSNPVGTLNAILASGIYNYLGVCNPGDYVMVWICPDIVTTNDLIQNIRQLQACNDIKYGLKFFGKIFSIDENFSIDGTGVKIVRYNLTANSFDQYMSQIFTNPFVSPDANNDPSKLLYANQFFSQTIGGITNGQNADLFTNIEFNAQYQVAYLHQALLGHVNLTAASSQAVLAALNNTFVIPQQIGQLFGMNIQNQNSQDPLSFMDITNVIIGVQTFGSGTIPSPFGNTGNNINPATPDFGPDFNLQGAADNSVMNNLGKMYWPQSQDNYLKGIRALNISPNMAGSNWQLVKEVSNSVINEMYTTLRLSPTGDSIFPTFICRQLPFSLNKIQSNGSISSPSDGQGPDTGSATETFNVTMYGDLPRFKIQKEQIIAYTLNKNNQNRVNLFWLLPTAYTPGQQPIIQNAINLAVNGFSFDPSDTKRHGVRLFRNQIYEQYNLQTAAAQQKISKYSQLLQDINGNLHLKLNGTLVTWGIYDPICIGENLEIYDDDNKTGILFHIEAINHSYQVLNGLPIFRTSFNLSYGLGLDENENVMQNENEDSADVFHPNYDFISQYVNGNDGLFENVKGGRFAEYVSNSKSQGTLDFNLANTDVVKTTNPNQGNGSGNNNLV